MAKVELKEPTLNGEAFIIKYSDREYLNLRVKRDGKRYTHISLGTTDIQQAHKLALDAYVKVKAEAPKSRTRKLSMEQVFEDFLLFKDTEVDRGLLKSRSYNTYEQRVHQRIIPFCRSIGIRKISDIEKNSFDGYSGFFLDKKIKGKWKTETSGLKPSTINNDISTLNHIFDWMLDQEMIDPRKKPHVKKIKDRTQYRDEANPAFLPEDWRKFCDALYKFDQDIDDNIERWKHRWFINWIRFQYQGGFRPSESRQITFGDCEVVKRKDDKLSGIIRIKSDTKTGSREVAMNGNTLQKVKYHLNKGIKLRKIQIEQINKDILDGKRVITTDNRRITELLPETYLPTKDDLLLMNPFFPDRHVYHMEHIRQWYKEILSQCSFDRKYTIYSLRSTHISYALLQGQRVNLVAKNTGTSLAMIQRTYDGLSSRFHVDSLGFFKEPVPSSGEDSLVETESQAMDPPNA